VSDSSGFLFDIPGQGSVSGKKIAAGERRPNVGSMMAGRPRSRRRAFSSRAASIPRSTRESSAAMRASRSTAGQARASRRWRTIGELVDTRRARVGALS
jgi:hypothetical protein